MAVYRVHSSCQVRSFASLDSPISNALAAGTEVVVVERLLLASGRERARISEPVEGWVSVMFFEKITKNFTSGPLSAMVLRAVRDRRKCDCGSEVAFADLARGRVVCRECQSSGMKSLNFDAFSALERRVLLCGGTCDSEHGPAACEPRLGEFRVVLNLDAQVTIADVKGVAVILRADKPLKPGDYIVGVGSDRVWRFNDVKDAVRVEKTHRSTWRLVIRRVPILHDAQPVRHRPVFGDVSSGGPDQYRPHAHHASVLDYWEDQDDDGYLLVEKSEDSGDELLAAVAVGPGDDVAVEAAGDRAVIRDITVVGVDSRRDHVTYDDVHRALQRPPVLLLCVFHGRRDVLREMSLPPGRIGLRLEAARNSLVVIADVIPGLPASLAGAHPGTHLVLIDSVPVVTLAQAETLLRGRRRPCTIATTTL